MDCWRQIDGRIYLTGGETARRLDITKNALEVAKSNLKKIKTRRKEDTKSYLLLLKKMGAGLGFGGRGRVFQGKNRGKGKFAI